MKSFLASAVLLLAAATLRAEPAVFESGESAATLVELFTSEGCSSCPPADAWMSKLKTSPDLWQRVVPVVFHVDYWNGLGWPDRFASREFTARQQRYAAAWRSASVYTPGFVLDGREWKGWFGRDALPAPGAAKIGKLRVTLRDRTHAEVTFSPAAAAPKALRAELALLGGDLVSEVQRGENRGRKLRHDFVVLQLVSSALAAEDGRFTATLILPEKPAIALAAWIVAGEAQPPLQATGGWLARP